VLVRIFSPIFSDACNNVPPAPSVFQARDDKVEGGAKWE
jgi:hypothetical protein